MEWLQTEWRELALSRWPRRSSDPLRAWDAADEYLLDQLVQGGALVEGVRPLLLNDACGALAAALVDFSPVSVSDSWTSQQATRANFEANKLDLGAVTLLDSLATLPTGLKPVVIKIPKSHALLEQQLHRIRAVMKPGDALLAGGMAKHIHTSTLALFERIIGPTNTSLARKKARLVFAEFEENLKVPEDPYPLTCSLDELGITVLNHANVFSREKLDIGTRFFLQHLPSLKPGAQVVDLGCGNGLLGVMAARTYADASVLFVDESHMAVASARANVESLVEGDDRCEFRVSYCLDGVHSESADVVLNNPPFHQQHAVGDEVAWKMFTESLRVLREGGELYVVGNRHLGYHNKLKRLFGQCETVASNQKFVILKAIKAPKGRHR